LLSCKPFCNQTRFFPLFTKKKFSDELYESVVIVTSTALCLLFEHTIGADVGAGVDAGVLDKPPPHAQQASLAVVPPKVGLA
jgi:hypothetical protein